MSRQFGEIQSNLRDLESKNQEGNIENVGQILSSVMDKIDTIDNDIDIEADMMDQCTASNLL